MLARRPAILLSLALAAATACAGARVSPGPAPCPAAAQLLSESARARAEGSLFRALARAEAANRACSTETTREAVSAARSELYGPDAPPAATAEDAATTRTAAYVRISGDPARALSLLQPLSDGSRLDGTGLVELARAADAGRQAAAARRALEQAAARTEKRLGQRGRWRWQQGVIDPTGPLAISPDGTKLVSQDVTELLRVWDLATGRELARLSYAHPGRAAQLDAFAFSPDGQWIIAATSNGPLFVWSVATGKQILALPYQAPIAFTPDGDLLASLEDGLVRAAIPSGKELARLPMRSPRAVAVGDRIYAAHRNEAGQEKIVIWELGGAHRRLGELDPPADRDDPVMGLAASKRGDLILTLRTRVVITDGGGKIRRELAGPPVTALSPDGKHLLAVEHQLAEGSGGLLVDLADPGAAPRRLAPGARALAVAFHPRGGAFASLDAAGISLWSRSTGQRTARFAEPTPRQTLAFDADGRHLALVPAGSEGPGTVFDLIDGAVAGQASADAFPPRPTHVQPELDEMSRMWMELPGGRRVGFTGMAATAALQPGGALLATSDSDGRIPVWDVATERPRHTFLDPSGTVTDLDWSPDGRVLASAAGNTVRLWDPSAGTRLATFDAHAKVRSIAFHPGGRWIAAACEDGLVELWAISTGKLVAMLAAPGVGRGLVLAPDGAVDGALADGDPLFWDVGGEALPARAVWEREAVPGLLPARLAALTAETWPRPGLAGAGGPPAPPPCYTRRPDIQPDLVSAAAIGGNAISFCIDTRPWERTELPTCFEVDLASGAYRPRAPTADEALGRPGQVPGPVTAKIRDGKQVSVCRDGACRAIAVPELGGITASWIEATANDAASLVAVILPRDAADDDPADTSGYDKHKVAIIYDVTRGRRLARIDLGEPAQKVSFVGDTLLVTNDTCGGSCVSSTLVDPRTGKRIAKLGGDTPIDVTYLSAARATGDVYAFSDSSSPAIVLQDVKTGRVVRRFDHEVTGCQGPLRICMRLLDVGGRLAVVDAPGDGDSGVALYDARGKLVARHPMPVCKPASP